MNVRKYETRLNENGFVMLNLVFSKYIPEIENNFSNSEKNISIMLYFEMG